MSPSSGTYIPRLSARMLWETLKTGPVVEGSHLWFSLCIFSKGSTWIVTVPQRQHPIACCVIYAFVTPILCAPCSDVQGCIHYVFLTSSSQTAGPPNQPCFGPCHSGGQPTFLDYVSTLVFSSVKTYHQVTPSPLSHREHS